MASGIYGMGAMITFWPPLESVTRIGGALFLFVFGGLCFRSAFSNQLLGVEGRVIESFWPAFWAILGVTLLNPHVYLDTLIFIGGIGAQYGADDQLYFAMGAISASWVWFIALGYGAKLLRPTFENPKAWTILDIGIALVMWSVALTLLQ
jgi:L-lysine exporter family protein LysE/ArgO